MPRGQTAPIPKPKDSYIWTGTRPARIGADAKGTPLVVEPGEPIDTEGWTRFTIASHLRRGELTPAKE